MKQNSKTNWFSRTAAIRVVILIACFTMLFAFAMFAEDATLSNEMVIDTTSLTNEVAYADDSTEEGGTKPVYGSSGGPENISMSSFTYSSGGTTGNGFPGMAGNTTSWTYTDSNMSNFSADTVSVAVYNDGIWGDAATGCTFNNSNYTLKATGGWLTNVYACSTFQYKLGSAITSMVNNDNVTVTAKVTYTFSDSKSASNSKGLKQAAKQIKAGDCVSEDGKTSVVSGLSDTITINPGTAYLVFILYSEGKKAAFAATEVNCTLSNVSFQFTFTLNKSFTEKDTTYNADGTVAVKGTNINDGSAPVVASQYEESVYDEYAPYIDSTNKSASINNDKFVGSGSWPMYYDSIATNLSKATDSIDNAAGKLRSYTKTSLGTAPNSSKNYYKYSSVTYLDTYNYAKTGSYTYSTMQGLTLVDLQNFLKCAGIAGGYPNPSNASTTDVAAEKYLKYTYNSNYDYIAAGIKQVIVGSKWANSQETKSGAVFNMWEIAINGTSIKTIYGTSYNEIGVAKVTKNSRGKVKVECFIYGNDDVSTKVIDYGEQALTKKITFSGIDTTAPTSGSNSTQYSNSGATFDASDYIKVESAKSSIAWFRQTTYTEGMSIELYQDDSDDVYSSPYVWFLITHRADSWTGLPAAATQLEYDKATQVVRTVSGKKTVQPIAYNTLTSFSYDFSTGKAKGYGSSVANIENPTDISDNVSGFGYYRFDIYLYDAAGHTGQIITYYMKVDFEAPVYDLKLSYVDDLTKTNVVIDKDNNGSVWATGETTLELSSSKLNKSGNTLEFEDANGTQHILAFDAVNGFLNYDSISYGTGTKKIENLPIYHGLELTTKMDITFSTNGGKYYISFKFTSAKDNKGQYDDVAWIAKFNLYIGQYAKVDDIDDDEMATYYINPDWKNGAFVLIDRNNPMAPTFVDSSEEANYIYKGINGYSTTIVGDRVWWTGSMSSFGAYLGFKDSLKESEYAANVKVYYGIKVVHDQTEMTALKNSSIETIYKTLTKSNYSTYLDALFIKSSDVLDDENTELAIDLIAVKNAGMRIIYVWAIDQAGNISTLNNYFILADDTKYTIASSVLENAILAKDSASILQTTVEDEKATVFKRGETVVFKLSFEANFVGYKFSRKYGTDVATDLLINNSNEKAWTLVNASDSKIIEASGYTTIYYTVDDMSSIAGLNERISLILAQREVVTYTITNSSVVYTGAKVEVPVTYSNEKAKDSFNIRFVDWKGNILYEKTDGTATTKESEAKLVSGKPVYFVPSTPCKTGIYQIIYDTASATVTYKEVKNYEASTAADFNAYCVSGYAGCVVLFSGEDADGKQNGAYYVINSNGSYSKISVAEAVTNKEFVSNLQENNIGKYVKYSAYNLIAYIDKDNASFVTYDFALDDNGNQIFDIRTFNITKGSITITVTPTTSTYGDAYNAGLNLKYTVVGIDTECAEYSELIKGALILNVTGTTATYNTLPVGKYQVIEDPSHPFNPGDNFTVTFISDYHTISAKQITISVVADQKEYGNVDPEFRFTVTKADVSQEILTDAFENHGYTRINATNAVELGFKLADFEFDTYAYYLAGSSVSRKSGESVGKYAYQTDTSLFDIGTNYKLIVSTTNEFKIVTREIALDVSDQHVSVPYGTDTDVYKATVTPSYRLAAKDLAYESVLAEILDGKLSLGGKIGSGASFATYQIVLDASANTASPNFTFTIGEGTASYFYIDIEAAGTVIFTLKDSVKVTKSYGDIWSNATSLTFSLDMFDITYPSGVVANDIVAAKWTVSLSGVTNGTKPNAGTYLAIISDVELYSDVSGAEPVDAKFYQDAEKQNVVDPTCPIKFVSFNVTIDQSIIKVVPTATSYTKVYGAQDKDYGIGYSITSIGTFTTASPEFATLNTELAKKVKGSFARALYETNGAVTTLKAYGSRYDDVLTASNLYYGFGEIQKFTCSDTNYKVVVDLSNANELTITPYALSLKFTKFKGISKAYDNTTKVTYTNLIKAYELDKVLVTDDVELDFYAVYTSEKNTDAGFTSIKLSNLGLKGTKAANYKLSMLNYDLTDITKGFVFVGEEKQTENKEYDINAGLSLELFYEGYETGNEDFIRIFIGIIGVHKTDITVTKQYDGTNSLSISNITIKERTDADGLTGTAMLSKALANAELINGVGYDVQYSNNTISSNYTLTLSIKFPMATEGITVTSAAAYTTESDIEIIIEEDYVLLNIKSIKASITQRVINANSFTSITAGERDYNSKGDVTDTIKYVLKDNALASGDVASDLGLTLGATISGANYNAGQHAIVFDKKTTAIKNDKYIVDVDNLNLVYTGDKTIYVTIAKAKLLPYVSFEDKTFDLTYNVTVKNLNETPGVFVLTTLRYAGDLESELAQLSIAEPTFCLSVKGEESGAVAIDDEGNVTTHNVLVKGLVITQQKGSTINLSNYEVYGYRYNSGEYLGVGSFDSGEAIKDYELLNVVTVNQKVLTIMKDTVDVAAKVYDGEKTTSVSINYETSEETAFAAELQYLQIQGNGSFARAQVGYDIAVTINDVELVVKAEYIDTQEESLYKAFITNYSLSTTKIKKTQNIKERPVVVSAELATREYDKTAVASKVNYTISLIDSKPTEKLTKDLKSYSVQTNGGAYFDGKDVKYDTDGKTVIAQEGVLYNPTLRSSKGKFINYVITYATTTYEGFSSRLVAYKSKEGQVTYYPASESAINTTEGTYYYTLSSTTSFISANDYDSTNDALKAATIGRYTDGTTDGYTLTTSVIAGVEASKIKSIEAVKYFDEGVKGIIEPRSIYISSDGIVGPDKFTKQYDGTTSFKGTIGLKKADGKIYVGTNVVNATDVSCYYDLTKGISGVLGNDDVTVDSITAQYSSANTTAKYVVFLASGVSGADSHNYSYSKTSVACKVSAEITPIDIHVTVTDYEVEYGTNTQSIYRDLEYNVGQKVYKLATVSAAADIKADTFVEATFTKADLFEEGKVYYTKKAEGVYVLQYGITKFAEETEYFVASVTKAHPDLYSASKIYYELVDESNGKTLTGKQIKADAETKGYLFNKGYSLIWDDTMKAFLMNYIEFQKLVGIGETDELKAQTYNLVGKEFVKAEDGVEGTYLRLAGSAILPKTKGIFASPKPQAEDVATAYKLVEASNTNFTYVARYTGNSADGLTSKLSIYKRDMYISITAGSDVVKVYGGLTTSTSLTYLAKDGSNGIVSGETWLSIFKKGNNDYRPEIKFYLVTLKSDKSGIESIEPIGENYVISSKLADGQFYVMGLEGVSFVVGEYTYTHNDVANNYNVYLPTIKWDSANKKFYYEYRDKDGNVKDFKATALTFSVVLPDLSNISITDSLGLLTYEYTYDGEDKLPNIVMGTEAGDKITINGTIAKNAGEYKGFVTVERAIKLNDDDTNGYTVTWVSSSEVTLIIKQALAEVNVAKGTKNYDGYEYVVIRGNNEGDGKTPIVTTSLVLEDGTKVTTLDKKYIDIKIYLVVSGQDDKEVSKIVDAGTYKIVASLNEAFATDYPNYAIKQTEIVIENPEETDPAKQITKEKVTATAKGYAYYTVVPTPIEVVFSADTSLYTSSYVTGSDDSDKVTKVVKFTGDYATVIAATDIYNAYGISYNVNLAGMKVSKNDIELVFKKDITGTGKYSFEIQFKSGKENKNYTFVNYKGVLELTSKEYSAEGASIKLEDGIVANKLVVNEISSENETATDNQYWAAVEAFMPYVGDNAHLAAILQVSLYYDNQLVGLNGKETEITVDVPSVLNGQDLKNIAIYEVTADGGLMQISYSVVDGKIVYKTTTLGNLVFVSTEANNTPNWFLALVITLPIAVVLFVGGFVVAFILKKKKLQEILM